VCVCVCVGQMVFFSSNWIFGRPGWKGTEDSFCPGLPTDHLEEKKVPSATIYSRPPDDGPQMGPKHVQV
jgi:hypothetical protein